MQPPSVVFTASVEAAVPLFDGAHAVSENAIVIAVANARILFVLII